MNSRSDIEAELNFWEEHLEQLLTEKEVPLLFPNKEVSSMLLEYVRKREIDYWEIMQRVKRLQQKRKELLKTL